MTDINQQKNVQSQQGSKMKAGDFDKDKTLKSKPTDRDIQKNAGARDEDDQDDDV
jgi:hypothetical protein